MIENTAINSTAIDNIKDEAKRTMGELINKTYDVFLSDALLKFDNSCATEFFSFTRFYHNSTQVDKVEDERYTTQQIIKAIARFALSLGVPYEEVAMIGRNYCEKIETYGKDNE